MYPAQGIVADGVRAVETQRYRRDTGRLEPRNDRGGQQRGAAGCHRDLETERSSRLDQGEEIPPLQRITARQDQVGQRRAEAGQAMEKTARLGAAELGRVGLGRGFGPAVAAGQVTRPRDLPVDASRRPLEAKAGMHHRRPGSPSRLPISMPLWRRML